MRRIGLIAGEGMLPVVWAECAFKQGVQVETIALTPATEVDLLSEFSHSIHQISVGELNRIIETLKAETITEVVMMGKVQKTQLFLGLQIDQRLQNLLQGLPEKNDDAILLAIVNEMAREGITFIEQTTFMNEYMALEGQLISDQQPGSEILDDMKYGFKMAKEIGRLDIGQTVIVKDGTIIAVEAIEGTDQTILRGGELAQGVIVAKVSKPQQDLRFDIPTIGLTTMQNMVSVGARGLVVEADKTFFIQQDEVLRLAREMGIVVIAMR